MPAISEPTIYEITCKYIDNLACDFFQVEGIEIKDLDIDKENYSDMRRELKRIDSRDCVGLSAVSKEEELDERGSISERRRRSIDSKKIVLERDRILERLKQKEAILEVRSLIQNGIRE